MKALKVIILTLIGLIIIVATLIAFFAGSMCENHVYKEIKSPNGLFKAIIFQRDCGATTAYSTQISILKKEDVISNSSGNIFIIKGIPQKVAPDIEWDSNTKLVIHTNLTGKEFKAKTSYGWYDRITIIYR